MNFFFGFVFIFPWKTKKIKIITFYSDNLHTCKLSLGFEHFTSTRIRIMINLNSFNCCYGLILFVDEEENLHEKYKVYFGILVF